MFPRPTRYQVKLVAFAAAYFACAMVARLIKANPHFFSFFWLPTGLLFGTLMISDRREWRGLIGAALIGAYLFYACGEYYSLWRWALSRLGDIGSIVLGVWLTQRLGKKPFKFESVRSAAILFFIGGFTCQMVSATVYAYSRGFTTDVAYHNLWLEWYIINMLGLVVLAPPILLCSEKGGCSGRLWASGRGRETAACLGLFCGSVIVSNLWNLLGFVELGVILLTAVFWAAVRLGSIGVAAMSIFAVICGAVFPVRIYSVFGATETLTQAQRLAIGIEYILVFIAGFLIALAIEERRKIEALLANKNAELQAALARSERLALDLNNTNTVLQHATHAKTEFIRTVSHEIRNPLAGVQMISELLERGNLDARSLNQVRQLQSCLAYIKGILNDSLDLAQIELGQTPVELNRFRLGTLVADTMIFFGAVAQQKGIAYDSQLGELADRVFWGDKNHLQRVLINYLSNAFKFTTKGSVQLSVVQVGATTRIATLRFTVKDSGIGVPLALQKRIFSAYVRSSIAPTAGAQVGAGVGLALCQKLAELDGGVVGFQSQPGQGAEFWIELPLIVDLNGALDGPDIERPDFPDLRVLVVDDDAVQRDVMKQALEEFGVQAETAHNVEDAVRLLSAQSFPLALIDFNLGSSTGIELVQRFQKARGTTHPTKFHLITGHITADLEKDAVQAGFFGVHRKPISLADLYELLSQASLPAADQAKLPSSARE